MPKLTKFHLINSNLVLKGLVTAVGIRLNIKIKIIQKILSSNPLIARKSRKIQQIIKNWYEFLCVLFHSNTHSRLLFKFMQSAKPDHGIIIYFYDWLCYADCINFTLSTIKRTKQFSWELCEPNFGKWGKNCEVDAIVSGSNSSLKVF